MTDKRKCNKKAIKQSLVKATWEKTLRNEEYLPRDLASGRTEVLVGIMEGQLGVPETGWCDDGTPD